MNLLRVDEPKFPMAVVVSRRLIVEGVVIVQKPYARNAYFKFWRTMVNPEAYQRAQKNHQEKKKTQTVKALLSVGPPTRETVALIEQIRNKHYIAYHRNHEKRKAQRRASYARNLEVERERSKRSQRGRRKMGRA